MSRSTLPYYVGDVSTLAKSLRQRLQESDALPSHVEMLNLLARAGGYRNFQHFKAQHEARSSLDVPRPVQAEINFKLVKRLLRLFDQEGRLGHWPKKYSERIQCLWIIWSRVEARKVYAEHEMNDLLNDLHLFGDHALLRRLLVDHGLMSRTADGREYRRVEIQPPVEALEVIRRLPRMA